MSKAAVLITSILSIILAVAAGLFQFNSMAGGILFLALILVLIINLFVVFVDVKKREKPIYFIIITLFLGGIGGIIYYSSIYNDNEEEYKKKPVKQMAESSKKMIRIMNIILAVIFGAVTLVTLPWSRYTELNLPLTMVFGILFLVCILIIIYVSRK